jgi:protein-S-isoprenylcysteine O-methyltransferase Ste14
MSKSQNPGWRWLQSTSNRTFVLYPSAIIAYELLVHQGALEFQPLAVTLLVWGYLQYKLAGRYRLRHGSGGPGLSVPPLRLCTDGPYRWVRNPMYLGHLIFLAGLALTFKSWAGAVLLALNALWFDRRVRDDESRLARIFGNDYHAYAARVKRWLPGFY